MKAEEIFNLLQKEFNLTVAEDKEGHAINILSKEAARISVYADFVVSQKELPELLRDNEKIEKALEVLSQEIQPLLDKLLMLEEREAHRLAGIKAMKKFNQEFEDEAIAVLQKYEAKMNDIWKEYKMNIDNRYFTDALAAMKTVLHYKKQ